MKQVRCGAMIMLATLAGPALAGRGAGELALDRSAVLALLRSGTPPAVQVDVPALGTLWVDLEPPAVVEFADGGIEGRWTVTLTDLGYASAVAVRLVPSVEPLAGTVRLEPEWAIPEVVPPGAVDLAPLLPPLELPRGLEGAVPGLADPAPRVRLQVQGLEVEEERLVIRFGLLTAP